MTRMAAELVGIPLRPKITGAFMQPRLSIADVATFEEARQARDVAAVAGESEPIAGGMMCFAFVGAWANQAMGLGMHGPVSAADVDRLIRFYEERGVEPRIEVCPRADESLVLHLAERQFVVRDFETVFYRDCRTALPAPPAEVTVRRIDPASPAELAAAVDLTFAAFGVPRTAEMAALQERVLTERSAAVFVGRIDGVPAGIACASVTPPCGGMFATATLPAYRRRGVQRALMIARLAAIAEVGAQVATVQSRPGVATERNAWRLGFRVAYTKAILVRPRPGLAPSV